MHPTLSRQHFIHVCASSVFAMACAYALSYLWQIAYIYTLIGLALLMLLNELVQEEDELISAGVIDSEHHPFSLPNLIFKAGLLCSLCFLALQFPVIRHWGA